MRRMNYDRFAKPANFGEWDNENAKFVLDKKIDEGIYLFKIKSVDDDEYNSIGFIEIKQDAHYHYSSGFMSYELGDLDYLVYNGVDALTVNNGSSEGTIIYLYKLD